ncbi:MAG: hypothetical protein GX491_10330 [Chloroflexi bacterium]|nr:hypothetical protein [Chloroflexota bacterium]
MNQVRLMNPRRLIITAVLLLVVSAALLFWARDLVRELIVNPLSYLIWLAGIFIRSTNQMFFWYIFAAIALIIAVRSLAGRKKVAAQPPMSTMLHNDLVNHGRLHFWIVRVSLVHRGSRYYLGSFHDSLSHLLIDQLAYRFHLTPAQVEERLRENSLDVPPEIREYALSGRMRSIETDRERFSRLWSDIFQKIKQAVREFFSGQPGRTRPSPANAAEVDPRIARILEYMEKELEVSHDDSGR